MEITLAFVAVLIFVAYRQYLAHHRRIMVHRERMAALEKGVNLPPLEQEVRRSNVNIQRVLLLAGMIWIAMGVSAFVVLSIVISNKFDAEIPPGMQYAAIAPIGIGIAHLVALFVGRNKAS
jgi:hypothetical protein